MHSTTELQSFDNVSPQSMSFSIASMDSPISSPCSSPSPQSETDSDAYPWSPEPKHELKSVIASTPDSQLRSVMEKLVDNPVMCRAIARELYCLAKPPTSLRTQAPAPAVRRKSLHKKRPSAERALADIQSPIDASQPSCVNCHKLFLDGWVGLQRRLSEGPCVYHPGKVEIFEFHVPNTESQMRTMAMWTCCEADYDATGCVAAHAHYVGSF